MKNLSPINENKDVVTKEYVDNATVASAEKLTSSAGSSTVPVYFEDGKPKVCAYTLGSMSKESASDYEKVAVTDEKFAAVKNDIALNRTTLGYQCKNLHDTLSVNWYQPGKTSVASDGTVTTTITSDSRSFTYANSEHYITLEAGNYIITANTLEFGAGSSALIRGCNSDNQSLFALSVSSAGLHKAAFSLSKKTTIGIMYKLYSQTCTIMIRDADVLDDTYEPYSDNVDTRLIENKSNTAINKSTLGYQCKNLLKNNAVTKTVNGVTFTVNDDKSVTLNGTSTAQADFYLRGAWGSTSEILQKNKYIASIGVSQSSTFNGVVMHCINNTTSIGSPSCNYPSLAVNSAITAVYISVSKGYTFSNYKLYPMIRYADITDDTYEPYQPSVQEQTPYSLSVSGKSTSAAISYSGVPTLICLTPNTADSTAGGLYMINSAGAVVKLIEKTGVVVAAASSSKTFTITNNTSTVMDVCISRCWGR